MNKYNIFPPELVRAMFNASLTGQPMGITPAALASVLRRQPKPTVMTIAAKYEPAEARRKLTSKAKEPPTSAELRERWRKLMAAPTKAPWL